MKVLFTQCMDCSFGLHCYETGFKRCPKIESAAKGLGVPSKPKDTSYIDNIPFSVYMSLKHMVSNVEGGK